MTSFSSSVPVTVLTGFLGAGKTTLLQRILTERHGRRIAVIQNEFGEIGIDEDLVIVADEEMYEMNNGCICCSVRGDLLRILFKLMKRKKQPEAVIIETTGLADPGPVIQTFLADPDIQEKFELDAIVTLVDCAHVGLHLDSAPECRRQIGFADVVILNKTDLVPAAEVEALEARLKGINALARYHRATQSRLGLEHVLDLHAFDLDRVLQFDPTALEESAHRHADDVVSVALRLGPALDIQRADAWLSDVLTKRGKDIFRVKGILNLDGMDQRYVFQGVHMNFHGEADLPWSPDEARETRLVFIGQGLDRVELRRGLENCIAPAALGRI